MKKTFGLAGWAFFCGLLLLSGAGMPVHAADPTPATSPDPVQDKIETLAKAMIAAPTDDDRRRLLADAPPELARDERVRRRFHYLTGSLIYAGEYDRARALHAFSRRWCEEFHDEKGVMLVEWGEGNIEGYRGNNRAALAKFDVARRFFEQTSDTKSEASILLGSSIVYLHLGEYRPALAGVERALAIHRPTGDRELITNDLNTIGSIYNDEGESERAAVFFNQALAAAGDDEEWQGVVSDNIGEVLAARGDLPGAIAATEKGLALARKHGDRARAAQVMTTLADDRLRVGQPEEAGRLYREVLGVGESLADTERQTAALIGLCNVLANSVKSGQSSGEALTLAERASTLARQTGKPSNIWQARTLTGRFLRLSGRREEARAALEEGIAAIEDSRGRLTGGDVEATTFFEDKLAPYQEMVALLVDQHQPSEALAFAEQAKARVLLEVVRGPKTNFEGSLTPEERDTLKKCGERIAASNRELATAPATDRHQIEERLQQARVAREAAEEEVLSAHPELRRTVPPSAQDLSKITPTSIKPLLGRTDERIVLLEFVVCHDETFVFTVRHSAGEKAEPEVGVVRLPLGRSAWASRAEHYRRTLAVRGLGWMQESRTLGDELLAPVRAALAEAQRLIVVPDGPLWEMPFQTLPLASGHGALRAEDTLMARRIAFAPSLGFLVQNQGEHPASVPTADPLRLLAFGNPAVRQPVTPTAGLVPPKLAETDVTLRDEELLPLPDAEREVQALQTLYGADHSRVFVGREAREATFWHEAANSYDVIHFATHGIYNDRAPLYSHLLLSQTDLEPDEDGLLEAWELMRLKLHTRLVVLSACETARGRVGDGEGVIGLSWALFTAGCPACVVSQWKVDSKSNTALMVEFHRQFRTGLSKAEALCRASLALAQQPDYQHPFYWAPFVLIGDGN